MDNQKRFAKARKGAVGVAVALGFIGTSAQAAVPESLTTAITGIGTDATSLMDSATPIVFSLAGAFVIWKIGKRILNRV